MPYTCYQGLNIGGGGGAIPTIIDRGWRLSDGSFELGRSGLLFCLNGRGVVGVPRGDVLGLVDAAAAEAMRAGPDAEPLLCVVSPLDPAGGNDGAFAGDESVVDGDGHGDGDRDPDVDVDVDVDVDGDGDDGKVGHPVGAVARADAAAVDTNPFGYDSSTDSAPEDAVAAIAPPAARAPGQPGKTASARPRRQSRIYDEPQAYSSTDDELDPHPTPGVDNAAAAAQESDGSEEDSDDELM